MVVLAFAALACGFNPAVVAQDTAADTVRIVRCGRLLDVAESVRRMRLLVDAEASGRQAARRRLARELDQLIEMLGL